MGRPCACCSHIARDEIDAQILAGVPNRRLAPRYGMDEASIRSHIAHHLSARVRQIREEQEMWSVEEIARRLQALDADAHGVLDRAKKAGDDRLALAGIDTAGRNLERVARLSIAHDLEARVRQLEEERDAAR